MSNWVVQIQVFLIVILVFSIEYVFDCCNLKYLNKECSAEALKERVNSIVEVRSIKYDCGERRKFIREFIHTE